MLLIAIHPLLEHPFLKGIFLLSTPPYLHLTHFHAGPVIVTVNTDLRKFLHVVSKTPFPSCLYLLSPMSQFILPPHNSLPHLFYTNSANKYVVICFGIGL